MSLKDRAGLIKMIAMVSVEDYTIVGVGGTLKESIRSYKNALNSSGNVVDIAPGSNLELIEDVIQRINSDNRDGNTLFYFTTKNQTQIFVGSSLLSTELVLTKEKDSVLFEIESADQEIIDLVSFRNKSL